MDTILDFDQLWNYNDPAGTEQKFRALLPNAETGDDPSYYAQLLTQLARTLGLQRKFDEAHQILDQVETMLTDDVLINKTEQGRSVIPNAERNPYETTSNSNVIGISPSSRNDTPFSRFDLSKPLNTAHIRSLLERGRVFNSSKHPDQARPLFLDAWERAKAAHEDFYAVDAAHMLGIVEKSEASLAWNLQAIAYAEQSDSPRARGWLGSLYNNTGWTYHDLGEYEKALNLFERGVIFRQTQGNTETLRIARWCVARCLRSLGRTAEALEIQLALFKEGEETGAPDAYTQEELGELYLLAGDSEKARPHFAAAYAQLSQDSWLAENEPARIARLKDLGKI